MMTIKTSRRSAGLAQSEIRAMTIACHKLGGINMAQGVCDLDVPACVLQGAGEAMSAGRNSYSSCEGLVELRRAVAAKQNQWYGMAVNPEEVLISVGATGAFYATCLALLNPGDEVIVFEPYYGYHVLTLEALGCVPRFARLSPPDWTFSESELDALLCSKTKAILINNPMNPSGKVFSDLELSLVAQFACTHDLGVIADEIYEHFIYDGRRHIPIASLPAMAERTITISGFSKIYSVTGWRLGYAIGPPRVIEAAAHFNDLVYVCAPTPLQWAAASGVLQLPQAYYQEVAKEHQAKRDMICTALSQAGLNPAYPQGAYYVLADIGRLNETTDKEKVMELLARTGIATVPGSAFYHGGCKRHLARFCYAKKMSELKEACRCLKNL